MCIDVVGRLIVSACLSRLHPYYPAGQLCLGRGPVVQKGIRQFGLAALFVGYGCWKLLSHVLLTQRICRASKRETHDLAASNCTTCGICVDCFAFGAHVFSCAVCLAAWLAITTAVVFTTARAMLQSVLRRSKHDSCCRAIVAAATCSLCERVRMCSDVVGSLIVSACLSDGCIRITAAGNCWPMCCLNSVSAERARERRMTWLLQIARLVAFVLFVLL